MPQSTDLVTDLPADFETFGQAVATSMADLLGGTTGQILSKASNTDMDFTWVTTDDANAIQNAIVDAKGDLIAATAADTPARLAVGANGTILMADSTAATGIKWDAGTYTSFTPGGFSGFTLGNGTATGRYRQDGKTVFFTATITLGSTSSVSGSLVMQFPVGANTANNNQFFGNATLNDTGTATYYGRILQNGLNFMTVFLETTSGTYNQTTVLSATAPFTWTTTDTIILQGTYEAA
jgi:hypothetical protein